MLAIFGLLVLEYSLRTYKRRDRLSHDAVALWNQLSFKLFCGAVIVAYFTILIRCIYRIPELLGGWGGALMRVEIEFILLEGVMIVLTVAAQTAFHPGYCFPALANTMGKKAKHSKIECMSETEMEMLGRGETA